ncbi:MAG: flippase-like domain-containing protein [Mediterranea massiliensis]|nr:flippase-like domain-containing protein [Mediterranea massiliensis]
MNKVVKTALQVVLPFALGCFILYWVYRDFNFQQVRQALFQQMHWGWMIISLFFGVMGHVFRGWRWKLTLEPIGEHPRTSNCVDAIFLSYATNLIIPRIGEVSRCGVLAKYDNVSFAKSLGTVVTERIIDTLLVAIITAVTLLVQLPIYLKFFHETGAKIPSLTYLFTTPWFYVILFSSIGVIILLIYFLRMFSFYKKVKGTIMNLWEGILSLRKVNNKSLFILYTLLIWLCYFLHFYLTFYCFAFSEHLGVLAGLVMFVGGTFAVIVPTPNGTGPWHFAIITMMMLYGVSATDASLFALLVHGIQTLLVIVLGVWGWGHLQYKNKMAK